MLVFTLMRLICSCVQMNIEHKSVVAEKISRRKLAGLDVTRFHSNVCHFNVVIAGSGYMFFHYFEQ